MHILNVSSGNVSYGSPLFQESLILYNGQAELSYFRNKIQLYYRYTIVYILVKICYMTNIYYYIYILF